MLVTCVINPRLSPAHLEALETKQLTPAMWCEHSLASPRAATRCLTKTSRQQSNIDGVDWCAITSFCQALGNGDPALGLMGCKHLRGHNTIRMARPALRCLLILEEWVQSPQPSLADVGQRVHLRSHSGRDATMLIRQERALLKSGEQKPCSCTSRSAGLRPGLFLRGMEL